MSANEVRNETNAPVNNTAEPQKQSAQAKFVPPALDPQECRVLLQAAAAYPQARAARDFAVMSEAMQKLHTVLQGVAG